jgi:hypothetical protein
MTSGQDEELERLHEVIADLKRQNAVLRGMLTDAIDLAGAAIKLDAAAADGADEDAPDDNGAWDDEDEGAHDGPMPSFKSLFSRG